MTAIGMTQRRKAITYGKASRKHTTNTGAAFTQAAEIDIWDPRDKFEDLRGEKSLTADSSEGKIAGLVASKNLGRRKQFQQLQPRNHNEINGCEYKDHSSLISSLSTDEETLDIPSSDDDHGSKISASDGLARKRRRLSPRSVADNGSFVFDDDSLQRHIAAEIRGELSHTSSCHSEVVDLRKSHSAPSHSDGHDEKRSTASLKQDQVPKTAETQKRACINKVNSRILKAEEKTRAHPNNTIREHAAKPSRPPPKPGNHQKQFSKVGTRPKTPENTREATLAHRSGGAKVVGTSAMQTLCQPSTPPRRTQTADGATTPHQRELWSRLLSNNSNSGSPSNLNLPGLMLTEKRIGSSESAPTARNLTCYESEDVSMRKRPKRIVDTLYPSVHIHTPSEEEVLGDISSEDSSKGDRSRSPESEHSVSNVAITAQTSPSTESQTRGQNMPQQHSTQSSQATSALHGVGLKVTYARQRSYLSGHDLDEAAMFSAPVPPVPTNNRTAVRRGLNDRAHESQSTNIFDDGDYEAAQDSQGGAMRSIHELREAGGNVRLVGELEALVDDMEELDPIPTNQLRSMLMGLATKLQEPTNCRIFVDQGLESRLLAHVGHSDDLIANSLFAAAILGLISASTTSPLLAQIGDTRIVEFLVGLLGHDTDLASTARLRSTNLSRVAQLEYQKLCTLLMKSTAWKVGKPTLLSCHVLAVQCLEYVARQTRETGASLDVLSAFAIRRVIATSMPSPSTASPSPTPMLFISLELALSILESCTISNVAECQESLWSGDALERVTALLPLLLSWKREDCATSQTLTLRLYLNLTNNNPGLCDDFSTPEIVEALFRIITVNFQQLSDHAPTIDKVLLLDHLILSLGSFINLAESSCMVRNLVMDLQYGGQSYVDASVALFMTRLKIAAEVRYCYFTRRLAILISTGLFRRRGEL